MDIPDDVIATQTSGFHMEENTPERGDFEIGLEEGEGYIRIPIFMDGEVVKFSIPRQEVEWYMERREEKYPSPKVPDGFRNDLPSPEGWSGGSAEHTGGGIWCRIWRKEIEGGHLEVIYGIPSCDGVSINVYAPEWEWCGEIETNQTSENSDEAAHEQAIEFMKAADDGAFDEDIAEIMQ